MNCLWSLYVAHKHWTYIYENIRQFEKREYHSNNFGAVMDHLNETIIMQQHENFAEVNASLKIRMDKEMLDVQVQVKEKHCVITKMERLPK